MKSSLKSNLFYAAGLLVAALAGTGVATATSAQAQTAAAAPKAQVKLTSDIMVERVTVNAAGVETQTLKSPKEAIIVPGDKLVISLNFVNQSDQPATDFRATNPIPAAVQFIAAKEDWAELSVDGGKTWGDLSTLTIAVPASETALASTRPAQAADVTHVRWSFKTPLAPGAKGTVSFRGSIK